MLYTAGLACIITIQKILGVRMANAFPDARQSMIVKTRRTFVEMVIVRILVKRGQIVRTRLKTTRSARTPNATTFPLVVALTTSVRHQ